VRRNTAPTGRLVEAEMFSMPTMVDYLRGLHRALTVGELVELLNVSKQEIYKLVALRRIPSFRVGTAIRFDPAKIAAWIKIHSNLEP
jgi:excisionase family DNA binding protein